MRVSSLYNSAAMLRQLNSNNTNMSKLMQQMATQQRVNVPSDDPVASSRLVLLNREQSALTQYQSNITRLSGDLSGQEAHVTAMSDQLLSLHDKLLSAANGTHSTEDMKGYGEEVGSMLDSLVAELNSKSESGTYQFSGTKTDTKPVVFDPKTNTYSYAGNDGTRETAVANDVNVVQNTLLSSTMSDSGDDLALLNQLKDISDKMQDPTVPVASYSDQLNALLDKVQGASDKIGEVYTDLGGRQNRLSMFNDAHTDVKNANDSVARDLSALDPATAYVNLNMYSQAMQASNMAYMKISQLSLFSVM